jgi:hypothetical protein
VDVAVSFLAAEAEDVKPFCRHRPTNCLANAVHDLLQSEVFIGVEVRSHSLSMLLRGDERVAVQTGVLVQERDGDVVFVEHVMAKLRIACEQLADEAAPAEALSESFEIERLVLDLDILCDAGTSRAAVAACPAVAWVSRCSGHDVVVQVEDVVGSYRRLTSTSRS